MSISRRSFLGGVVAALSSTVLGGAKVLAENNVRNELKPESYEDIKNWGIDHIDETTKKELLYGQWNIKEGRDYLIKETGKRIKISNVTLYDPYPEVGFAVLDNRRVILSGDY